MQYRCFVILADICLARHHRRARQRFYRKLRNCRLALAAAHYLGRIVRERAHARLLRDIALAVRPQRRRLRRVRIPVYLALARRRHALVRLAVADRRVLHCRSGRYRLDFIRGRYLRPVTAVVVHHCPYRVRVGYSSARHERLLASRLGALRNSQFSRVFLVPAHRAYYVHRREPRILLALAHRCRSHRTAQRRHARPCYRQRHLLSRTFAALRVRQQLQRLRVELAYVVFIYAHALVRLVRPVHRLAFRCRAVRCRIEPEPRLAAVSLRPVARRRRQGRYLLIVARLLVAYRYLRYRTRHYLHRRRRRLAVAAARSAVLSRIVALLDSLRRVVARCERPALAYFRRRRRLRREPLRHSSRLQRARHLHRHCVRLRVHRIETFRLRLRQICHRYRPRLFVHAALAVRVRVRQVVRARLLPVSLRVEHVRARHCIVVRRPCAAACAVGHSRAVVARRRRNVYLHRAVRVAYVLRRLGERYLRQSVHRRRHLRRRALA